MKINTDTLKESFKLGYETFADSRERAANIMDLYHNRQYNATELSILAERGQPAETFNIIKLFARQIIGYYSTTINTAKAVPKQYSDITIASILNDTASYVNRTNYFDTEGDKLKLDLILTGLMVSYNKVVVDTNPDGTVRKDRFGRNINKILKMHIPAEQVVLDPRSIKADNSDARFTHVFKWVTKEEMIKLFGLNATDKSTPYYNFLNVNEAEHGYKDARSLIGAGIYRYFEDYLVVHTIMEDDNGDTWSIYWSGDNIFKKHKVTTREVKNPYTIVRLQDTNKNEYYGIFNEVSESQRAINQALIQIQLMANSNKVLVRQDGAVEDLDDFIKAYSRVNAVIPVIDFNGIKVENMSGEIQQQYIIIDKAFDRIQRMLGINDSFLGMAYAADSGRKVKLQQNATIMALRYLNNKLELFYRLDGWKTFKLIKQYFRTNQILRIVDETVGERWVEINKPIIDPTTEEPVFTESIDPDTGKVEKDSEGNIIMVPLNYNDTDLEFSDFDVEVVTVAYNDEDEKNQLMLETMLSGNIGVALQTVNPAGFMKASALSVKSMKSKHSADIAQILEDTAKMLQPQPEMQGNLGQGGQAGGQSANSQTLKLPQNTNEGV